MLVRLFSFLKIKTLTGIVEGCLRVAGDEPVRELEHVPVNLLRLARETEFLQE